MPSSMSPNHMWSYQYEHATEDRHSCDYHNNLEEENDEEAREEITDVTNKTNKKKCC